MSGPMAVTAAHNFFRSSVADLKETFPFPYMLVLTKVDSEEPGCPNALDYH